MTTRATAVVRKAWCNHEVLETPTKASYYLGSDGKLPRDDFRKALGGFGGDKL